MRKVMLFALLLMICSSAMAQVEVKKMSFDEAIIEASKSGRQLLVMGSTTWCGPCKAVIKNVFPNKELGDYLNSRYVVIKIDLDTPAAGDFGKKYEISSYPTFVIFNGEGKELNRFSGAPAKPEAFVEYMNGAMAANSLWSYHEEKYKKDPSYGDEYFRILAEKGKYSKANEMLKDAYLLRTPEQNFDKESLNYYKERIKDLSHPIFQYMMKNESEVDKVMGSGECRKYIQYVADRQYASSMVSSCTAEMRRALLKFGDDNDIIKTDLYHFVKDNDAYFANDNFKKLCKSAKGYIKRVDTETRSTIFTFVEYRGYDSNREYSEENRKSIIGIAKLALKYETNEGLKGRYNAIINKLSK